MNILYDLVTTQPNVSGKRHGGGIYGEIVFTRMVQRGINVVGLIDSSKWLNPHIKQLCIDHHITLADISTQSIDSIVSDHRINRFYSPLPINVQKIEGCDAIGTLHGLRELETPADFFFWRYKHSLKEYLKFLFRIIFPCWYSQRTKEKLFKRYFASGIKVVTVSNHSKYSIRSYYPELEGKDIKVFYSPSTELPIGYNGQDVKGKYYLLVSGNRWEKNNLRAIIAFDRLISSGSLTGVKMVVTGCNGEFRYKIKNPESFELLGYVSDEHLCRLYQGAYAFVYPSLNEGFGYPPLEAMRFKVPVLSSPYSSLSEILNGAALFFNPLSIEEIESRLLMIMDHSTYKEFSMRGYQRYLTVKEKQDKDLDSLIDHIITE